jgi:hypothetical protein
MPLPPVVPLVAPVVVPLEEVHTSPFGQAVELEQPETIEIASPAAISSPKNIERISFLLDPPVSNAALAGPRLRPHGLYPDA